MPPRAPGSDRPWLWLPLDEERHAGVTRSGDSLLFQAGPTLHGMIFAAGQTVRILAEGIVGRVFLKLPLSDVYLVQLAGSPEGSRGDERLYNGSELELDGAAMEARAADHQHA